MWGNLNNNFKTAKKAIIFIIPVIATFFGAKLVQEYSQIKARAGLDNANFFTQPNDATLPTFLDFQVWVTVKNPVGFVATEISFDKSAVKLSGEIDTSPSPLKNRISVSSMDEANNTGKITITLGLEPTDIGAPANGTFRIANLKLDPNTDVKNINTKLNFITQNTQVVGMDESNYTITAKNTDLKVNEEVLPNVASDSGSTALPSATATASTAATSTNGILNTNRKRGDVDKNNIVNILDIGRVVNSYDGDTNEHRDEDVNGDGKINILDLGVITDNYE